MGDSGDAVVLRFPLRDGMRAPARAQDGPSDRLDRTTLLILQMPNRTARRPPRQVPTEPLLCLWRKGSYLAGGHDPGSDLEPRWVTYLDRHAEVVVLREQEPIVLASTVLRSGRERDRLYEAMLADWPGLARFEKRTGLLLPIIKLEPVD